LDFLEQQPINDGVETFLDESSRASEENSETKKTDFVKLNDGNLLNETGQRSCCFELTCALLPVKVIYHTRVTVSYQGSRDGVVVKTLASHLLWCFVGPHRKEIRKLTFRALALRRRESL